MGAIAVCIALLQYCFASAVVQDSLADIIMLLAVVQPRDRLEQRFPHAKLLLRTIAHIRAI